MTKRWFESVFPARQGDKMPSGPAVFSLARLEKENPGLARQYLWDANPLPAASDALGSLWLHFGCGERVLDGFINLDFIPNDARVTAWNLLDLWPDAMAGKADGAFSEDTLEHFFYAEQAYILCNLNRALKPGAVARTLMPSLARLIETCADYRPAPDEFLHNTFGVETGGDALNMGMRFSGHRWLHDMQSLTHLAAQCGFATIATDCAHSTVEKLCGLNIRDENNSLSFASDLCKTHDVSRLIFAPQSVDGAHIVEDVSSQAKLYQATVNRPTVEYFLPSPVAAAAVGCLNFRSSNLSSFAEHNLKTLRIDGADDSWNFDETLKSRPCMNLVTQSQLKLALHGRGEFSRLAFSPAAMAGEYFTLGCTEIYIVASP